MRATCRRSAAAGYWRRATAAGARWASSSAPPRTRTLTLTLALQVGIELCPTSNLVAMNEIPDLTHHHFPLWWPHGGEVSITVNTDDAGLFNCSLSSELRDIAEAFDLTWGDLVELEEHAIDASFHPEPERLRAAFRRQLAAQAAAPAPGLTPEPAPLPPKAAATVAAAQDASA
mmetsp:Transcript_20112/g.61022  ORF Transcript_20112/g.61022 Transcript_20112/m.61022 type:complete len:174 (-) Transcript_20112:90-611(-)